ncbi:MAG TPA: STAS domain-containing protein [Woeseiaceae bacterium]|nr:STAS domain-containing protein [Woeseiaceae bacterium]
MFQIDLGEGGTVKLAGRLDAAQVPRAQEFLAGIAEPCSLDLEDLDYISSAGLGVLLRLHKRLVGGGGRLKLVNVNPHIKDILAYSGFDKLFEIEPTHSHSQEPAR